MKVSHVTLIVTDIGAFSNSQAHKNTILHIQCSDTWRKKMGHLEMESVQHKPGPRRVGRNWYRRLWELFSAAKDRAKAPLRSSLPHRSKLCSANRVQWSGPCVGCQTCGSSVHRFYIGAKPLCEWVHQQIIFTRSEKVVKVYSPHTHPNGQCYIPSQFSPWFSLGQFPSTSRALWANHLHLHASAQSSHDWLAFLWWTEQREHHPSHTKPNSCVNYITNYNWLSGHTD